MNIWLPHDDYGSGEASRNEDIKDYVSSLQIEKNITMSLPNALQCLSLPSFGATNSLLSNVDNTITNVFTTPLIPGPASSYSAIYTALVTGKNISARACGKTSKVVVSLDLDLYEKLYLLVNFNDNLRSRYVLCLGELHAVFAHLRAIGSFISGSGIDDSWIAAGWFDSQCLVRQVLECSNMKRANSTH